MTISLARSSAPSSPTRSSSRVSSRPLISTNVAARPAVIFFCVVLIVITQLLRFSTTSDLLLFDISESTKSSLSFASPSTSERSENSNNNDDHSNSNNTKRYYEFPPEEFDESKLKYIRPYVNLLTSYHDANVVERSHPWFVPKKICKNHPPPPPSNASNGVDNSMNPFRGSNANVKCCAETVAISLDQDDRRIINTIDGPDLADVMIQNHNAYSDFDFFAKHLTDDIVECLQPGTIIHVDTHQHLLGYFFKHYRPKMPDGVKYVITTSESDGDSPQSCCGDFLADDPNMIAWLGQSPNIGVIPEQKREMGAKKLIGFPLGISRHHNQDRYLSRFLELTNYTNPFANKDRYNQSPLLQTMKTIQSKRMAIRRNRVSNGINSSKDELAALVDDAFYRTVFVRFGFTDFFGKRHQHHANLCNGYNSTNPSSKLDDLSCGRPGLNSGKIPSETYAASSRYLFGFSPKGVGWDCYRTYEFLLLGVIPIVPKREFGNQGMFDDLPVLQLDDFEKNRTREEYLHIFHDYIASPQFQNNTFDKGWSQLFLRYWRRKVLDMTDRTKDIIVDPSTGREYYQAWRYSVPSKKQYDLTQEQRVELEALDK